MISQKKLIVSHAPFWHNGSNVVERNVNIFLAALPAALVGLAYFGVPALGVLALSVSSAIGWEWAINRVSKRPVTVGDGHAALIGLLFGMLLPATAAWWLVITGTFVAILIGKQIFGGIGATPFHPAVLALAILTLSWKSHIDFDTQLVNYNFPFFAMFPLGALKAFGPKAVEHLQLGDLLIGRQVGGIGATCGLALILGGVYLILRGFARWQIPLAFVAGIVVTATIFHVADPNRFAGPMIHLFTGYTLIGAFFLATDDASSPVNFIPMLIFGGAGGVMTILIRNIGAYPDGTLYAILVINMLNPLLDKIRPEPIGKAA